jgi:hypothetical protein
MQKIFYKEHFMQGISLNISQGPSLLSGLEVTCVASLSCAL